MSFMPIHGQIHVYLRQREEAMLLHDIEDSELQRLRQMVAARKGMFTHYYGGSRQDIMCDEVQSIVNLYDDEHR